MKRAILAALLLATSGAVYADCNGAFVADCNVGNTTTTNQGGTGVGVGIAGAQAGASAGASAGARANASQFGVIEGKFYNDQRQGQIQGQGQKQGQGQDQGQSQSADNNGNMQAINIEAPVIPPAPSTLKIKNTPDVSLGGLYPSAPCMGTSNIGGSGAGLGIGFGTSWVSEDCQKRETARMAPTANDRIAVWCTIEVAKVAPSCKKLAAKKAEAEQAARLAEQANKRKVSGQKEAQLQAANDSPFPQ